jgi:hypothetical protein
MLPDINKILYATDLKKLVEFYGPWTFKMG